ncbi:MAG: cytochrome c biogenesis protein CcdA [Nanoarchaeota archaeon]|nr:cytochrome c biogenesis protein CcdA [Nanoarchaeota archaeon]
MENVNSTPSSPKKNWNIFLASIFFVLGFAVIFSLIGVLLQSVLAAVAPAVQKWLGRIGGVIIIFFGMYLLGLINISFLEREHRFHLNKKFGSTYITSFIFGAAFALGWTPCVGAVLGAILALAVTEPGSAFFLMLSYSLGLGLPFLAVGLFAAKAQHLIRKAGRWLVYLRSLFGAILIALGVLVFTSQLSRIANLAFVSDILIALNLSSSSSAMTGLNVGIAFFAGLVSFLSPCVLPLIPAYLSYVASISVKDE